MGGRGGEGNEFIQLNLWNIVLLDVMDEDTAPGLWAKLKRLYMTVNLSMG